MISLIEIISIVLSYLLGAIPFGYILIKYYTGKNILELGSGNIGSTNVKRIAGKKLALITQLFDMFKGLLPVAFFMLFKHLDKINTTSNFVYILAFAAIAGHSFSLFLKFKGGKGVNTTLGASILIAPFSVLVSVLVYFLIKKRFKYVSLASICLSLSLPVTSFILYGVNPTFYYLLGCTLFIILMHRKNIKRLLSGTELR